MTQIIKWVHPRVLKANVPITAGLENDSFTHTECVRPEAAMSTWVIRVYVGGVSELSASLCEAVVDFMGLCSNCVAVCLCTYLHN